MTKLIALHQIKHNWTGLKRFTGRYDADGEPIVRSVATIIRPGEPFEVPDHVAEERDWLLEVGAARPMTDVEIALDGRK